jgi:Domain of unknown function (DUF4263)
MVAPEITNAVVQVLDQRQRLMLHFLSVMHGAKEPAEAYSTYSIDCVILAGMMPESGEKQRTFETYRGNFKDVRIITFDDCSNE